MDQDFKRWNQVWWPLVGAGVLVIYVGLMQMMAS